MSHTYTHFFITSYWKGGGGGGADNLTKVIMGALKEHGGFFYIHISTKLISFGVDGVNVF